MTTTEDIQKKMQEQEAERKALHAPIRATRTRLILPTVISALIVYAAYALLMWVFISYNISVLAFFFGIYGFMFSFSIISSLRDSLARRFGINLDEFNRLKSRSSYLSVKISRTEHELELVQKVDTLQKEFTDPKLEGINIELITLIDKEFTPFSYQSQIFRLQQSIANYRIKLKQKTSQRRGVSSTTAKPTSPPIRPANQPPTQTIPKPAEPPGAEPKQSAETPAKQESPARPKTDARNVNQQPYRPVVQNPLFKKPLSAKDLFSKVAGLRQRKLTNWLAKKFESSPNYLQQYLINQSVGEAGELFVIGFEKSELTKINRPDLAAKVCHVSKEQGDDKGFDILSFDSNGKEKLIEVKSTTAGYHAPFFLTENELDKLKHSPDYCIYRLYNFNMEKNTGLLYIVQSPDDLFAYFTLEPTGYRIIPNSKPAT